MIKTIKIQNINYDNVIAENGHSLEPIVMKYFNKMYCHSSIEITKDNIDANTDIALFFSELILTGINFVEIETRIVDLSFEGFKTFFDRHFLDINTLGIDSSNILEIEAIKLVTNYYEDFIGYYFPKYNILWATDWTHYDLPQRIQNQIDNLLQSIVVKKIKKTKHRKIKNKITLGCDPEYEIIKNNRIVSASNYFSFSGEIGTDGAGGQLELRPSPGTPTEVVKNIKNLLKSVRNHVDDISVNGNTYPLGGHIHIGGLTVSNSVIELLDDFIGKKTIDLSGNARESYKVLSAYETKPWGFEYRTPPAAIFHNPQITKIVLKIVKNAIEKALTRKGITYNYPTTKQDYINIGLTEKETNTFFEFIDKYNNLSKRILAFWKIKPKASNKLDIVFRDEWNEINKNYVIQKLEKMKIKRHYKLVLFGLKQSRGLVSTIEIDGFGLCSDFNNSDSQNRIGLPWVVRNTWDDNVKNLLDKAINKIKKYIKEQIKNNN